MISIGCTVSKSWIPSPESMATMVKKVISAIIVVDSRNIALQILFLTSITQPDLEYWLEIL